MKRLTVGRWLVTTIVLSVLLVLTMVFCAAIGSTRIDYRRALDPQQEVNLHRDILFGARIPRVLLAAIVGGALAAAGVVFQALLRNPLADPYILGISGGAALGAAIAILLHLTFTFWGFSAIPICAFLGSLGTIFLVYSLSSVHGTVRTYTLLLTGVIVNALFAAIIMFLIFVLVTDFSDTNRMVFWMMGKIAPVDFPTIGVVFLYVILGVAILLWLAGRFNLMSLGEDTAVQLGVDVERTKKLAFVAASLVTGAAVAQAGPIGFVGLIIPHILRLAVGPDHRLLLPASVLFGAIFLVIADTLARTLTAPTEIPVGVITAICGGPLFIWLLKRQQRKGQF